MRSPARAVSALTAAVLLVSLAACGGSDDADEASGTPASTPTATAEATPEEPTPEEPVQDGDVEAFLDRLRAGMGEDGSAHVEMRMTGAGSMKASGDTAYGPDGSDMRMQMTVAGAPGSGRIAMVLADGRLFLSMPGVTPPGKYFEAPEGSAIAESLTSGSMSPADSFEAFEAGLEKVEPLGEETIAGEPTEHLRLHLDSAAASKAMGMGSVPGLPETIVYDLWLDEDDRMRRLRYELAGTRLVMDMTRWGADLTIDPPAKRDLVEAPAGI